MSPPRFSIRNPLVVSGIGVGLCLFGLSSPSPILVSPLCRMSTHPGGGHHDVSRRSQVVGLSQAGQVSAEGVQAITHDIDTIVPPTPPESARRAIRAAIPT
jgi:hypothetical protein